MLERLLEGAPPLRPEFEVRIYDLTGALRPILDADRLINGNVRSQCLNITQPGLLAVLLRDGREIGRCGPRCMMAGDYFDWRLKS